MVTLDDVIAIEEMEKAIEQKPEVEQEGFGIIDLFKVETGREKLEVYQESPLCFDGSRPLAKVIRGISGFLAHFDFADISKSALLDIIFGAWEWMRGLKVNGQRDI